MFILTVNGCNVAWSSNKKALQKRNNENQSVKKNFTCGGNKR